MRATHSLLSTLAAVALGAAARPAAAQSAVSEPVRPAVASVASTSDAAVRTLASYRLGASRQAGLPAQVTVADSAGALVASYRLPGARTAHPMAVTVIGTDLVLQGETPSGVLTLRLHEQNDADASSAVTGNWSLEGKRGNLRGRATR